MLRSWLSMPVVSRSRYALVNDPNCSGVKNRVRYTDRWVCRACPEWSSSGPNSEAFCIKRHRPQELVECQLVECHLSYMLYMHCIAYICHICHIVVCCMLYAVVLYNNCCWWHRSIAIIHTTTGFRNHHSGQQTTPPRKKKYRSQSSFEELKQYFYYF